MFTIEYYSSELIEEIGAWPEGILACYLRITQTMITNGANLGMPYTKALGSGLFEIRAKGKEGIGRAFFCTRVGMKIVILHAIIKKSQKTPKKDIELARKRLKEIKENVDSGTQNA